MKSWIFAHFLLWSFLGLKKLTDSTFVFKHIYTDTCSVIVEGCQKLHELVFVFHQDFLNWRRFIWVCNKHLQNKYYCKGNSLQMQTYFQSSQKLICLRLQAIGKVTFNVPLPIAFSQVNLNPWISKSTPKTMQLPTQSQLLQSLERDPLKDTQDLRKYWISACPLGNQLSHFAVQGHFLLVSLTDFVKGW